MKRRLERLLFWLGFVRCLDCRRLMWRPDSLWCEACRWRQRWAQLWDTLGRFWERDGDKILKIALWLLDQKGRGNFG